jgi:WD40 repeat protein
MMDHPSIAKVFDAGATPNGRPYFVMELVKGIPITDYSDERELDPRQRLELFVRVCQAVHHAHQKGIIHRDLKPANVLVADYSDEAVPKVIDFGVAKATGPQLTEKTTYTQYGQLVGTLEYMSPEQANLNQLDIDTRSDIYSLGVLLYELLTGAKPFEPGRLQVVSFDEILRIIREEDPPKPSTRISTLGDKTASVTASRRTDSRKLRRDLRGELDWIVMRAMDKERSRRYESAAGLGVEIERFLNNEPVRACPPSTGYRVSKFVRRHRGPVIAAAAVVLVLILGLAGTSFGYVKATRAEKRAVDARDDERRVNFRMALDRGLALCDEGHVGHGMLWLARALELCPADAQEMERVVRANLNAWHRELNAVDAMFAHEAPVISVAVNPRGDRLVTGSSDHTAQIWNLHTGEPIGEPLKHSGDVHELRFSSDGTLLLSADYLTTAFLWDSETGQPIHTFNHARSKSPREVLALATTGGVLGAVFRPPDNRQIVTSCGDGTVTIWDARTGDRLGRLKEGGHMVHDVAVSPDGQWILTACHDSNAQLWDFESRRLLATFKHDGARVTTAAFHGKGARVVTGTADGSVFAWEVGAALADEDRTLETIEEEYLAGPWRHRGTVHRLRVSPAGPLVLTASFDNTARLWNLDEDAPEGPAFEHQAAVQAVAFSPDGRRVAIACDDNIARLWRPAAGQSVHTIEHDRFDHEAVYTADGRFVLIKKKEDETATVYDAVTRKRLCTVVHPGGIRAVDVSRDRSLVMTGGAKNESRLFFVSTGELVHNPFRHTNGVWSVAISPDGAYTLAGGFDGTAQLRDVLTGAARELPIGARLQGVAFSPDSRRFAVAGADKLSRIFTVDLGRSPVVMAEHQSAVTGVEFSPDGTRLVTGSHDNTVRVWDAASGEPISAPMRHRGPVWYSVATAFSPDGRTVVTGCDDWTVRVWDIATSRPIGPVLRHEAGVRMVAFPSETEIRTGTGRGVVRLWNAERSPLQGDAKRIKLWVEVITGSELDADGSLRALDGPRWRDRRGRLRKLGGPPTG